MLRRLHPSLLALLLISACGGGTLDFNEGKTPVVNAREQIWIDGPTSADRMDTDQDTVSLQGGAVVPGVTACPVTLSSGFQVSWYNATTSKTGIATLRILCPAIVDVAWETAPIALAPGANEIFVTSFDSVKSSIATDGITVTRVAK